MRDLGRLEEAAALAHEAMAMFERLYGQRHRETMISSQTLASILRAQGKAKEAEALLVEAVRTARTLFGEGHPMTLGAQRSLSSLFDEQKRFKEAFELRQAELASAMKAPGGENVYVALALSGLGHHGLASGRFRLAETYFTRALEVRRKIHPPDHWRVDDARGLIAVARLRAGRYADAEADLLAAHEGLRAKRGPTAPETVAARQHLAELYDRWNRPDQAQRYRALAGR